MKIGNVLMTVALVVLIPVGLASAYSTWSSRPAHDPDEPRARPARVAAEPAEVEVEEVAYGRDVDGLVFEVIDHPRAGSDLFAEQPFRVDVTLDEAGERVVSVTVDLDRDGRIDERWRVGDGVTREASADDDERYDAISSWNGGTWRPLTVQEPKAVEARRARPTAVIDGLVMSWRGRSLPEGEKRDLLPALPVSVDVFQDEGFQTVNRAHVDLDRDGQIDQIWDLADEIRRRVSPDDDGTYPVVSRRVTGGWEPVDPTDAGP